MEKAFENGHQRTQTRTIPNIHRQRKGAHAPVSVFADNRPETATQLGMTETMNNGPQTQKMVPLQLMINNSPYQTKQCKTIDLIAGITQRQENKTGMPNNLKNGIENLSGMSMDHIRVHYNSAKPAQFNAHAYAQGSNIHIASGQEKHLPHEAWHVVQQAQGRVKPTIQMAGTAVNTDVALETEADVMGAKALQLNTVVRT